MSYPGIDANYDVVIIGAGVVGCAMARRYTLEGAKTLVIEKKSDILDGASKGNSAILHTGFDAPVGSLEKKCIEEGYKEYLQIRSKLSLPLLETGALVIAWTDHEEYSLKGILNKAATNGVTDAKMLTAKQLFDKEPHCSRHAKAGIYIPGESVIDPWTAPFAYLLQAIENGAHLVRSAEVLAGEFDGDAWQLKTDSAILNCKTVINCAGLYGDELDRRLLKNCSFNIHPKKGQFLIYDKSASKLINSIILPVPGEKTKGVVITRTIFGNILVGPTAQDQKSKDDACVDTDALKSLRCQGIQIIPALSEHSITATYAGIRPATEFKDYCIQFYQHKNYISVGGIRSTGLSSALGIASYVFNEYNKERQNHTPLENYIWPTISPIAESQTRDWMKKDNDGIVCHCELVTKREILKALSGPLAAASLPALKRRTRSTMGRCQGFYCLAQLSELTEGCFSEPIGISKIENN